MKAWYKLVILSHNTHLFYKSKKVLLALDRNVPIVVEEFIHEAIASNDWHAVDLDSVRVGAADTAVDAAQNVPFAWEWAGDASGVAGWVSYSASLNSKIETAWNTIPRPSTVPVDSDRFVDFERMLQCRNDDPVERCRNVRRQSTNESETVDLEQPPKKKVKTAKKSSTQKKVAAISDVEPSDLSGASSSKGKSQVKALKKGRAVVDIHCPRAATCHVYDNGTDVFDAMLNQTNIGNNNNKFYVIQVFLFRFVHPSHLLRPAAFRN